MLSGRVLKNEKEKPLQRTWVMASWVATNKIPKQRKASVGRHLWPSF